MKQIKRIIAREFLVLLSGVVLFAILWFIWSQVHSNKQVSSNKLSAEIEEIKKFDPYQTLLKYVETANSGKYSNWDEINSQFPQFETLDKQALKDYVATVNAKKHDDFTVLNSKFPEFGFDSTGVHKNFSSKQLEKLKEKSKSLESIRASFFYGPISDTDLISLGIFVTSILFGFRYLYYSIKWSLKQLLKN